MMNLLQHRLRVTLNDSRQITGQLLAFDAHMNIVLADAEEFRKLKRKSVAAPQQEEKRTLGLIILRGEWIVAMTVVGPPPADPRDRLRKAAQGPGSGKAAGRGQPGATGLLGVAPGTQPLGSLGSLGTPVSRGLPGGLGR
jgi:small nuclear ribonucleoprotein B and B'